MEEFIQIVFSCWPIACKSSRQNPELRSYVPNIIGAVCVDAGAEAACHAYASCECFPTTNTMQRRCGSKDGAALARELFAVVRFVSLS